MTNKKITSRSTLGPAQDMSDYENALKENENKKTNEVFNNLPSYGINSTSSKASKVVGETYRDVLSRNLPSFGQILSVGGNFLKGTAGVAAALLSSQSAAGGQKSNKQITLDFEKKLQENIRNE